MSVRAYATDLRLAGYLPKRVVRAPDWLACPSVTDICSISSCVSSLPAGWIDHWLANDLWLYDTEAIARQVIDAAGPYTLFAYRLSNVRFSDGQPEAWVWTSAAVEREVPAGYRSLGFDVAGKMWDSIAGCGCSPLSCNGMASEYPVNAHCLLDDLEAAFDAAEQFSIEKPEPGTYYVAEVLVEAAGVTATPAPPIP